MVEQHSSIIPVKLRQLGSCLVCGDAAIGINFSVPTCAPCKAFFRRNAVKLGRVEFVCQKDGDCPINYVSRRMCNCCRLAKCFRVGMQKSLIRSEGEREARKELIEQNRQKRAELEIIQKSTIIQPSIIGYLTEKGPKLLSAFDQTLLTNIFYAYERIYGKTDGCQYSPFPFTEHSIMHTFYNEYEERCKPLIEYFKLIPEFHRLSIDDKMRLIRNSFEGLATLNEAILNGFIPQTLPVSFKNLFGTTIADNMIHVIERIRTFRCDPILLKLIIIIWLLSTGTNKYHDDTDMDRIFDDSLAIFAGQSIYVELLWRYLESRLSSSPDVVKFFNKLVLNLLCLQRGLFGVRRTMYNSEDEIHKMTPLIQSMYITSKKIDVMDCDDTNERISIE